VTTVWLPPGWEAAAAPIATLLVPFGSPWAWWLAGIVLLATATGCARRRPRLAIGLATAGALAFAVAADGLVDDAYIQFRYAANLAVGHGLVFNLGQRIEGASGGLWIFLLAALSRLLRIDPGVAGRLLGLVMAAATVPVAAAAVRPFAGGTAAARAAVLWAAFPTAALYGATGLESGAFALALWLAVAAAAKDSPLSAAGPGALIATLRPEGALLAAAALPVWRRLPRGGRRVVLWTLGAGAAAAAARTAYFGLPVPNSALVKGVTAAAGPVEGLAYLGRAALELLPVLLVAAVAARRSARALLLALPAAAWTALVVLRGGDWMPGSRYLLPLAVVLILLAATAELRRPAAITLAAVVWCAALLAPAERPTTPAVGGLWRAMAEHRVQSRWWEALGTWLGAAVPPETTLAAGPVGALPYASRLPTFDLYGLCSPVIHQTPGQAGHRLWGLDQAVATGTLVLYPGRSLPQGGGAAGLLRAAQAEVAGSPRVLLDYHPLMVRHQPEHHTDIVADVIWVHRSLPLRPPAPGPNHPE